MLIMDKVKLSTCELSYKVFGKEKINVVIEMALGATAGEWVDIAKHLSKKYSVLLYERNKSITTARTPENIASELYELLEKLPCEDKLILIAHSQGALYAQQFTRIYPQRIKGIILIDPLSPNDNYYKEVLTLKEQKQSGFDKTANLRIMKLLTTLHLGFLIKKIMKKAPPFYYKDFSSEIKDYILKAITCKDLYTSALQEYKFSHLEDIVAPLKEKTNFPDIPLVVITHTSEFEIKEIMEFGRTNRKSAEKVESLWQSLMKQYLSFSKKSIYIQAKNSGHFIHLTEANLIDDSLLIIERDT